MTLGGAALSARLAAYQMGIAGAPWEPFFGDGSRRVLHSAFSQALPVPDALLGVVAYLAEGVALAWGPSDRYRTRPLLVVAYAALAGLMALGSLGLVLLQALVVHAFCTLCLLSALLSFGLVVPAMAELKAAWTSRRRP